MKPLAIWGKPREMPLGIVCEVRGASAYLEAEGEVQVWVNTLLTWSLHLAEDGRAYIFHKDTEEAKWA